MRSRWRAERGSAAAEFALALPAVVLVFAALLAGVQLALTGARLQDAAADAARALARGEDIASARDGLSARGLEGASLRGTRSGALVCAELAVAPPGPGALLGIRVSARSCAREGGL